jgi:hypothetical protein
MASSFTPSPPEPDEPPPFFGRWSHLYVAVIIYLALLIAAFDWFTRRFNT